jgi:hypothetical protein
MLGTPEKELLAINKPMLTASSADGASPTRLKRAVVEFVIPVSGTGLLIGFLSTCGGNQVSVGTSGMAPLVYAAHHAVRIA